MQRVNKRPVDHFEGKWEKGKKYTLYAIVKNNGTLFRSLTPKEKEEPYVSYDSTNETFSANAGWEIVEMSEDSRLSAMGGNGGGKSAYDIAVENGYEGTEEEWIASLKGSKGDKGDIGETGPRGPQGVQGNTGSSVDYPYELVNNRTTDDATKGLSAAEGKRLGDDLTQLEAKVTDLSQTLVVQDYIEISDFPVDGNVQNNGILNNTTLLPPNYKCTDFLPINDKCIIHWKGREVATPMAAFYSANNEASFISIYGVGNDSQDEVFPVAEGAKFVRINKPYGYVSGRDYVGIKSGIPEALDTIDGKISTLQGNVSDLQDADLALDGRIDMNDADIENLQAKDTEIEGRLYKIEGPYISPDNGVGGVTSTVSVKQGGAVSSEVFDVEKKWYAEAVAKLVTGSTIDIFMYENMGGGRVRLRIHNGNIQFYVFDGNNAVFSRAFSTAAGYNLPFNEWYHLMLVYNGQDTLYLYANGRLLESFSKTLVGDSNNPKLWEQDTRHSPKLFRVGYLSDDAVIADVVAEHFNGNNPFGYDSSNEELLVEFLPENMLKTSIKNTANDVTVTYSTEKTFDILTENPWAAILEGSGTPEIIPTYEWQKYKDTTTGKVYTARGVETIADWVFDATSEDLLALRTQTKTVGGQSIWGTGDIPAGSGSGSGTFVSVADFGATGDGVTDDTTALQTALEYARANNRALYFPNGTFLTRKGFVLTSGMRVTGEPDAIIQNAAATIEGGGKCPYTTTTANAAQGDHSVVVTDASKFRVGDEIVIWKSGSYTETMADITAINGNTITFDTSRFTADGTDGGLLNAVASAGYVLTDFAMFKTVMTKEAVNVAVENITIKPMSDMNEPHIYTSSPISQTKSQGGEPQSNFRVYNVTCYDSANDGISLQGSGDSEVVGCRVFNQKHKGIHWGTGHDKIRIEGNYVYGCGSAQYEDFYDYQGSGAMFFCSSCRHTIIVNNIIENCYKGVYGFNLQGAGEQDTDTIIANNTFKNCGLYGLMLRGGYRAVVVGNIFTDFNNSAIPIHTEAEGNFKFTAGVISNNVFGNFGSAFAGPAIQVTGARNLILAGNNVSGYVNNDASTVRPHCDITVATSEKVAITNNVVDGVIDISDSGNTGIVKDNNIETS